MGHITKEAVENLLGTLDDNQFAAIEATGASLDQIAEARSLAEGSNDIVGTGETVLAGPVKEVLTILAGRNR